MRLHVSLPPTRQGLKAALPCLLLASTTSLVSVTLAENPSSDSDAGTLPELVSGQQIVELQVRVVDGDGKPVANTKVTPWALRSSQGHGYWRENDERAGFGPEGVVTDNDGLAQVIYPYFRDVKEQTRTSSVSLQVDNPDYAYVGDLHIDVPLEEDGPHMVELTAGIPLELRPLVDGDPATLDDVFALWSDGRSWQPGVEPEKSAGGCLRIPAMPPGENSFLLVKLDGDRATHFSELVDVDLVAGERKRIDVPLQSAGRIEGVLSDNVPRPVRKGRVKVWTLAPAGAHRGRVVWRTWTPVRPDGTFTIDGWPADEQLQLIALCEGYIATSGTAPDVVENPRDPAEDPFIRPQVFGPAQGEPIKVAMTPLVSCGVAAVDENGKPITGVRITSWPNVCWWNGGSQVYCHPLLRGERRLRERDFRSAIDEAFPQPFSGATDGDGKLTLNLPAGSQRLAVSSETFELPVFLGRRDVRVELHHGEMAKAVLHLQSRGTENLGEWDKLAGVVFGCSTREGRRICALPGVRNKMDEFAETFHLAKNQRDPKLLSEAYTVVSQAFSDVGDHVEAVKWLQKAAEQAEKAKDAEPAMER